ncbi:MAG: alpha/beta fold hydrolase [Magnetovibrio sp.]|nr:alpha/beta fold hydrolase [Magnetovibrio sp.]
MSAIDLAFEESGAGSGVVILHGLFGMGRNWAGIAKGLAGAHRVLTVDLRNHGASPWADEMNYPVMAADVARLIEAQFDGPAAVVGHSMGGKTAMSLACERPDLVERLCVVDIAPVPYDHDFEAHLAAMANMNTSALTRRAEAEAALLDAVGDVHLAQFLSRNLKPADDGQGFEWTINVTAIATHIDDILDFPVYEADQAYEGRALFISGGDSDYVQPFHQSEIERLFPEAESEIIADAGHWVHAERPKDVEGFLADFLAA